MRARAGRAAVAVVTLSSGAAVLFGPRWLAAPGGLLLGFVLPGLALTLALFRARGQSRRALNAVERTMLAPALSLAVLVGAGLIIYVAGYTLNRLSWTSATVGVTLIALLLAPGAPARPGGTPTGRIARQLLPMALVLAILGFAGWLSLSDARRAADVTVTALSAAPPTPVAPGRRTAQITRTVLVTASGLTAGDGPYSLVVTAGHQHTTRRAVDVPGNGTWTATLALGPERTTIGLYRAGDTAPYRTLYIAAQS